ncbi:MAG: hypothetical protein AAGA23_23100 [Pseudomonadota bacterium]
MSLQTTPWYRETAMMVVSAVLAFTFASGAVILSVAISNPDPLVVTDSDYQKIRDDFRLTQAREDD